MGRCLAALAGGRREVRIAALFGRDGATAGGKAGKGLLSGGEALEACDVIVDFSTPDASVDLATRAAASKAPALVIGSTGFSDEQEQALRAAARSIAIVKSGNFSLGVNVLAGLVAQAARRLESPAWDIEIFEAHHRGKQDAPSGTALMLAKAATDARGQPPVDVADGARRPWGRPRREGDIGFAVMRGGGIVGEHVVMFAADDEILTLSHSARDRGLFARGALEAALWVVGRPPGLYGMADVLGFSSL
jgi:4-hydroxy-tetrahydrodipicolinate reductase